MKKQFVAAVAVVLFICGARLIPHLANFSPMICVALFAGSLFDKRVAYPVVLLGMLVSDLLLAYVWHYPVLGSWSLFTYTGLMAIVFAGSQLTNLQNKFTTGLVAVLGSNLGFWVWTNLGVWAFSGMYGLHVAGLTACFAAAIPFLQHSMMSAVAWYLIFVAGLRLASINKYAVQL
jgi:hypothetical protein